MRRRCRTPTRSGLSALLTALLLTSVACSDRPVGETEDGGTVGSAGRASETALSTSTGTPVTMMGAGDVAGQDAAATARLIRDAEPDAVFTTGDNAYPDGSRSDYAELYEPTWGSFKDRTHPVPGNHDYHVDDAAGYVGYFGADKVTNGADGGLYYAWDVGNGWRAYALNTEISTTGAQLRWLRDDVAAHPDRHYILYAHRPRYTSGKTHEPSEDICPLWEELGATGGLEIVLAGHNHQYERFTPMDCAGRVTPEGARSFVIGSGGNTLYEFGEIQRGSEFRDNSAFGVLKLVLHENFYEWEFIASDRGQDGSEKVDTDNAGRILDKGSSDV
jgi:hypothetical protein